MSYVNSQNLLGDLFCGHKDCIHTAKLGSGYVCNYLLDTKHKRHCKATPDCTEYRQGKHKYKNEYTKQVPDYWGTAKDYEV